MSRMREGTCRCGKTFWSRRKTQESCGTQCANKRIAENKARKLAELKCHAVWSCGGGVDSTAIALMIVQGNLPKPDLAFMTDVGWEPRSTWDYVTGVLRPRLDAVGVRLDVIKTSDYADNSLVDKRGYTVIPAYHMREGKVIKYSTRCSGPWKLAVAKRWLREQSVKRCENWIGIAADEARRAKDSGQQWFEHRYPLIEAGMTREDCLFAIGQAGWPMPPRTSCVMCPHQTNNEWRRMAKVEPEEFARACAIERELQRTQPETYLHQSCQPLAEWAGAEQWAGEVIDVGPRECNPFSQCGEGSCEQAVATW